MTIEETNSRGNFQLTFPVRLVADVKKSQVWFRTVFKCNDISGWGHATTEGMGIIRSNGGKIAVEPFEYSHGGHTYKKAHISDLDGYSMVLSARRPQKDKPISLDQAFKFKKTYQVRLVSDLKKSMEWYSHVLGCDEVNNWGYARRGKMEVILQQAASPQDVRPNALSAKMKGIPKIWGGPDETWDTFVHTPWEDVALIVEEVRGIGGTIGIEPFESSEGGWDFVNAQILDPDGYSIILGGMRKSGNSQQTQTVLFKKLAITSDTVHVNLW